MEAEALPQAATWRIVAHKLSFVWQYPDKLSEVTAWQRKVFQSTAGKEVEFRNLDTSPVRLILDALIGYGLQSAAQGVLAELIH